MHAPDSDSKFLLSNLFSFSLLHCLNTKSSSYPNWPQFQALKWALILVCWIKWFIILQFIYFLDWTIKPHSIEKLSSWVHIQDISSIFLVIFILSITNHYITYNLSVLWYCFYVSSWYTHNCNFKCQKQPNNINDQLSFLWWYNTYLANELWFAML